jgi:alpha-1,2-mannosyltransferase
LPRGLLVGLAIALKLTPAVFVLYFLMRKDRRAALTAVASFAAFTIVGFLFAWRDSVEYWTVTVQNTDRIGRALNTNQNISGTLERLSVGHSASAVIWALGSVAVLALSVWATRRLLRAGEPVLAVMCIGLLGLVVSPVSWSHHWVWMLPAVLTAGVVAYRRRSTALFIVVVAGIAVTAFPPFHLLPENHETTASWWRQIVGVSYMWWALAYLGVAGAISPSRKDANDSTAADDGERVPAVS